MYCTVIIAIYLKLKKIIGYILLIGKFLFFLNKNVYVRLFFIYKKRDYGPIIL